MYKPESDRRIFMLLTKTVLPSIAAKYNVSADRYATESSPCLILANHTTNFDFLWVALSLQRHMYIVASDHLKRMRFAGFWLEKLFHPIWRVKSASDIATVKDIVKRLHSGCNVLIFPEGNRSPDGENCHISAAVGKLVKLCKVPLITYRITGGYFMQPRWAKKWRRGAVHGQVIAEYSVEQLAAMDADEITDIIVTELHENAYETQLKDPVEFIGRDPAEYLETFLYACPVCHSFSGLKTHGDTISCECGMRQNIDNRGFFHGADGAAPYFETVFEWSKWQKGYFAGLRDSISAGYSDEPVFSDSGQTLTELAAAVKEQGTFSAYNDRFEFACDGEKKVFFYKDIHEMQVVARQSLMFSGAGLGTFELTCDFPRNGYKYIDIYDICK